MIVAIILIAVFVFGGALLFAMPVNVPEELRYIEQNNQIDY